MWSEEELRDIPEQADPDPIPPTRPRSLASPLRHDLLTRNRTTPHPHELTLSSSIIYTPNPTTHGNFIDASYRRILANPAWKARLKKAHTSKRQAIHTTNRVDPWCELDAATSSDALLMNIFCYPRVLASAPLPAFLGIDRAVEPVFGFLPRIPLQRNRSGRELKDTTEIDLKLGPLLIEAKLTESNFPAAPLRKLERYRDFDEVFARTAFNLTTPIPGYQLIRGVLAAHALSASFCLLCDARRPDLIDQWYAVMCAVRSYDLQSRLRLLTWQELARTLPRPLASFIADKYGILPA
jgi:hypothetical protein